MKTKRNRKKENTHNHLWGVEETEVILGLGLSGELVIKKISYMQCAFCKVISEYL